MKSIKISVIVPVYNVSKYLSKCLDSILGQTLKEIELIIINDCSPDIQDDIICKKYANQDDRIVYIKNNKNNGVSYSRNYGIKIAKGDYISFIDSDDYLIDNKAYEICFQKLIEGQYDFVLFGVVGVDKNYNLIKDIWFRNEIYDYVKNMAYSSSSGFLSSMNIYKHGGNFLSPHSWDKIYKKEFLVRNQIEFPLDLKIGEDRLFCMVVYYYARKIYTFKKTYYAYIQNVNSVTKQIGKDIIDSYLVMAHNEYNFLQRNNIWVSMKKLYLAISLPSTLRNISNKIESFAPTKGDEYRLMNYFKSKLRAGNLFDLFFEDPIICHRVFTIDQDFTDKEKIKQLLKLLAKKLKDIACFKCNKE